MAFHVGSFNLAYATFAVSFAAAVLYLIAERRRTPWLPSAEMLDDIAFRAVTFGFPMFTLGLILGSVWAHDAWGVYWQWDPKETAALFTWLVYGVYLHTRTLRADASRTFPAGYTLRHVYETLRDDEGFCVSADADFVITEQMISPTSLKPTSRQAFRTSSTSPTFEKSSTLTSMVLRAT